MPLIAKGLAPCPPGRALDTVLSPAVLPPFTEAAQGGLTVLQAPPGCVLGEGLAAALAGAGRLPLWLRLGVEDGDPATFLISLSAAACRQRAGAARSTRELLRARPGPVSGWPPLFGSLASELVPLLAGKGALVLENVDHASAPSRTLSLVLAHLVPALVTAGVPCVLVGHRQVPQSLLSARDVRRCGPELRLAPGALERLLDGAVPVPRRSRRRLRGLCGGRVAVVDAVRSALVLSDVREVECALDRATDVDDLLTRLAGTLLYRADRAQQRALGRAVRLEYDHPTLMGGGLLPPGPWLQGLEDGWTRVRTVWRNPLRAVLDRRASPLHEELRRAAEQLVALDAVENAVRLYLDLGDAESAARLVTERSEGLMDDGQWEMLDGWIERLPESALAAHPQLLYLRAEMAAASGAAARARHWFDVAASRFTGAADSDGACRSMLAASVVAAGAGDLVTAADRARTAHALAERDGLAEHRSWAGWQRGRLALLADDTESALAHFAGITAAPSLDAAVPEDDPTASPVLAAHHLARQVRGLRHEQALHRESLTVLEEVERDVLDRITHSATPPADRLDQMVGRCGWSHAPVPLKLLGVAAPATREADRPSGPAEGLWAELWRTFRSARRDAEGAPPTVAPDALAARDTPPPLSTRDTPPPSSVRDAPPAATGGPATTSGTAPARSSRVLAVHLLGSQVVTVEDVPTDRFTGGRARSLLAYLLTHRDPWPRREALMELFWPGSTQVAARNSLNVAIHGLRRTLRAVTPDPVIVYADGAYRLADDIRLWLDVEEFERRAERGRRLEDAGRLGGAMSEYEGAADLYRGDLLADDPYEDWPVLDRERLRLAHLDVLDRLGGLFFTFGRYASCAALCRRIVELDPCREDAHRRLMRCHCRQGRPHLALLQYRTCAQLLQDELGVLPGPATDDLRDRITRHDPI
ncbi:BTAD domain-containing putative transcriptional regulator [Streptomyces sp. C1-1]|uniref:BTAD domain-containing putative transcriptional regulator n=1 Tax=Streptomyces sp. C1-1 TaxID=3231173 RepID=UPI003D01A60E